MVEHVAPSGSQLGGDELLLQERKKQVKSPVFPLKGGTRVLPPFTSLVFFDVVIGMSDLMVKL